MSHQIFHITHVLHLTLLFLIFTIFSLQAQVVQVCEGVTYEFCKTDKPQAIHIIRANPKKVRITALHALDDGLGREPLSSMAKRTGAVAAINGGFFKYNGSYDGLNTSTLKINGDWLSMAKLQRGAIGWKKDFSKALFDRLTLSCKVNIQGKDFPISDFNRERSHNTSVLYNYPFHRSSLTAPNGTEIVMSRDRVLEIRKNKGNSKIPEGGFVYSVGKDAKIKLDNIQPGAPCTIQFYAVPQLAQSQEEKDAWQEVDFIVGGTPLLIKDGQLIPDIECEQTRKSFLKNSLPRTAIGTCKDGTVVMIVVDGRDPLLSVGMSIPELQLYMKELGCTNALNLDGGGSATMTVFSQVVNYPCNSHHEEELNDRSQRPISDGILILPQEE
jgi:exopolysaccharide biosynthesis protein